MPPTMTRATVVLLVLLIGQQCDAFIAPIKHDTPLARPSAPSAKLPPLKAGSSVLTSTLETIKAFSKSSITSGSAQSILEKVTERALTTPPIAYFFALMAAGLGVPVSEDALCIFAGAVWPTLPSERQWRLFVCLYLGVVVSDFLTFWIGRGMRMSIFQPLAKRVKVLDDSGEDEDEEKDVVDSKNKKDGKRNKIRKILQNSGDYAGFVIRFSVGTRGPLMLLTGFSNKLDFAKFSIGTSVGAMFTLPLQLYCGYALGGRNPQAVVSLVAGISSFVIFAAVFLATASWGTLAVAQLQKVVGRRT